ncbi:hypothetical protein J4462_01365 [Candidatus Pacearchaeota archaeon]|nr:hypothetical protein [Candidatus Pacearchaeota archaeon]
MKAKEFFSLFRESFKDLIRRPALIIPGLFLWVLISILSKISVSVNYKLTNSVHIISWLIVFSIVSLSLMSFIFSGLIGFSGHVIKKKSFTAKEFFGFGERFWLQNFFVMLMILVVTILIGRIAHFLAAGIGGKFDLAYGTAVFIFVLIYFIGLIAGLIWFTFGNFMVVLKDSRAFGGVRASASLVKKEYLATLSLNVLLFAALWLVRNVEGVAIELLEYGLVVPYLSLLFGRFVLGK